ncbi:hypothetical protein AB0F36_14470 [Streptomyces sp. NPDC029080]|uniref:hypothetical protein n=1 Tax=Streptomyces sp. NPDC029080 TaxID=3155017 RepID=UPI0033C7BACC
MTGQPLQTAADLLLLVLPGICFVTGVLAVCLTPTAIRHLGHQWRTRRDIRRLQLLVNNPNVRARYSRKEKP